MSRSNSLDRLSFNGPSPVLPDIQPGEAPPQQGTRVADANVGVAGPTFDVRQAELAVAEPIERRLTTEDQGAAVSLQSVATPGPTLSNVDTLKLTLRGAARDVIAATAKSRKQDDSVTREIVKRLDQSAMALHALLKLGVRYGDALQIFMDEAKKALVQLDASQLKNCQEAGFAPVQEQMIRNRSILGREIAKELWHLDAYQMHRDKREEDRASEKTPKGTQFARAVKEKWRGKVGDTVGDHAKFLKEKTETENFDAEAVAAVTHAMQSFKNRPPGEPVRKTVANGLTEIVKLSRRFDLNPVAQSAFMRHLSAAVLRMDRSELMEYLQVLDAKDESRRYQLRHFLEGDAAERLGYITTAFRTVAYLYGNPDAQRVRALTSDDKQPAVEMSPAASPAAQAKAKLRGTSIAFALALASAREANTDAQLGAIQAAVKACEESFKNAVASGISPKEAFETIQQGSLTAFNGAGPHAMKNALITAEWYLPQSFQLKLNLGGIGLLERNITFSVLGLGLHEMHRQAQDEEHANNAAKAQGLAVIAKPFLAAFREFKDGLRALDANYGDGRERRDASAAKLSLQLSAVENAAKAAAATQGEDEVERDAQLLVAVCDLLDFELPAGSSGDADADLHHIEDALLRIPVGELLMLEGLLDESGDRIRPFVADQPGAARLMTRLELLPQAVRNVCNAFGAARRVPLD
jgi:hypothetical protein